MPLTPQEMFFCRLYAGVEDADHTEGHVARSARLARISCSRGYHLATQNKVSLHYISCLLTPQKRSRQMRIDQKIEHGIDVLNQILTDKNEDPVNRIRAFAELKSMSSYSNDSPIRQEAKQQKASTRAKEMMNFFKNLSLYTK